MKILALLLALAVAMVAAAPANKVVSRDLFIDDAPHPDDPAFISAVMRAHWFWRRLHCAQDLVWDPELANAARRDIATCSKEPYHMRSGSNLSSVSGVADDMDWIEFARTASHGWHEEEIKYPYKEPHFTKAWGHFSQMVWRDSSRIGCAVGHCQDKGPDKVNWPGRFYCYYESRGNNVVAGEFLKNVWGPVCRDPSVAEVTARESLKFNWADPKKAMAAATI